MRAIGASIVPKGGVSPSTIGQIMPVDFSAGRHLIEDGGTEQIFGENEQTARIPVKPVDAAVDKREILLRKIVHDSVSQCIVVIVDRRMDGHIGRLVNHHQICIFHRQYGRGSLTGTICSEQASSVMCSCRRSPSDSRWLA